MAKSAQPKAARKRAATRKRGSTRERGEVSAAERAETATELRRRLARAIPDPRCELEHASAWQLLVATILSAQSTDRAVNGVTPALFARFPTPAALAGADRAEVEAIVRSTGFYRNKAKAICEASRMLVEQFAGEVPRTIEELTQLPGVARKTANVVLGVAYGIPSGIAVDTHAARVSQRLGWTRETDPVRIEGDLCALVPRRSWIDTTHRLILHGRYLCTSRTPRCAECPLNELCPAALVPAIGRWTERADQERALVPLK